PASASPCVVAMAVASTIPQSRNRRWSPPQSALSSAPSVQKSPSRAARPRAAPVISPARAAQAPIGKISMALLPAGALTRAQPLTLRRAAIPKLGQQADHLLDPRIEDGIIDHLPLAPGADQTFEPQACQLLADDGLARHQQALKLGDGAGACAEMAQNGQPPVMAKRLQKARGFLCIAEIGRTKGS